MSGCGGGGVVALQVIQTGAVGAMAYHTVTKKDPPLFTAECAWAERIESKASGDDLVKRWTRSELIQVANHNDRFDCHCKQIEAACVTVE